MQREALVHILTQMKGTKKELTLLMLGESEKVELLNVVDVEEIGDSSTVMITTRQNYILLETAHVSAAYQVRTDLDFQIFWSEISILADATEIPPWLSHFYFDPQKLRQFDADFEWRGHAYFSAGALACRRNAISFRRWTEVESWGKKVPGLFAWGEMGLLNYHVHSMAQRREIKTVRSNLQDIWEHHGKQELVQDCRGAGWHTQPRDFLRERQSVNHLDLDFFSAHLPYRRSARCRNASSRVLAMCLNTGPTSFSSRRLANS